MTRKLNNNRSENNQPIYVGIDVHKKHWSICLIDWDEIVGQFKIPSTIEALAKILNRHLGKKYIRSMRQDLADFGCMTS